MSRLLLNRVTGEGKSFFSARLLSLGFGQSGCCVSSQTVFNQPGFFRLNENNGLELPSNGHVLFPRTRPSSCTSRRLFSFFHVSLVPVFSRSFNPLPLPSLCLQLRLAAFSRRALVPHPKYNYRPQLNGEEGSSGEPSEQEMVRRAGLRRERQIPNSIG